MLMYCRSLLASTLDEYSRLLCSLFPPFFHSSQTSQPDDGAPELEVTFYDSYYTEGAYYYVQATDDQE
jgi:hypothetical protein